jgi:hypothetical protein
MWRKLNHHKNLSRCKNRRDVTDFENYWLAIATTLTTL